MILNFILFSVLVLVIIGAYTLDKFNSGEIVHKKGTHYLSLPTIFPTFGDKWYSVIQFTEDSRYEIDNQIDASKIFGITLKNSLHHHKNSIRFIWRYYQGSYQVGIRVYIDGKSENKFFDVNIDEYKPVGLKLYKGKDNVSAHMDYDGEHYLFTIKHEHVNSVFSLFLFPYFGGKQSAPKTVKYKLTNNKYLTSGEYKIENGMILNF